MTALSRLANNGTVAAGAPFARRRSHCGRSFEHH
jgi:hypothetical protein